MKDSDRIRRFIAEAEAEDDDRTEEVAALRLLLEKTEAEEIGDAATLDRFTSVRDAL